MHKIRDFYKVSYGTNKTLIHFSDKRTVSIKRTVWNLFKKSLLNVPYDPYIGKIIGSGLIIEIKEYVLIIIFWPPADRGRTALEIKIGLLLLLLLTFT